MWLLLASHTLAMPPRVAFSLGGAVGGGSSSQGDYVTGSPMGAISMMWHLGPFEPWAGASSTALLTPASGQLGPASLLQGELGIGLGGRHFGAGVYGGAGWPGPVVGLYARAMFGAPGWLNVGVEPRLFYLGDSGVSAVSVMARVELGRRDRGRRAEPEEREPRPEEPTEPPVAPAPPAPEGDGADALPVGEPPPPPPEEDRHHDEPY